MQTFKQWLANYQIDRDEPLKTMERSIAEAAWDASQRAMPGLDWQPVASFVPDAGNDARKEEDVLLWNPRYGVAIGSIYGYRTVEHKEVHIDSYAIVPGYHNIEWLMFARIVKPDLPENYDPLGLMGKKA